MRGLQPDERRDLLGEPPDWLQEQERELDRDRRRVQRRHVDRISVADVTRAREEHRRAIRREIWAFVLGALALAVIGALSLMVAWWMGAR